MKEVDSRDQLVSTLSSFIEHLSPDNFKQLEEEIRHDEKIAYSKLVSLYSGRTNVEEMSDPELYWLANATSKVSRKVGKPEEYFEDGEIRNYKYYLPENETELKRPLVFKNAVKLAENQYMFPCSIGEIKKLKNANILQIVPELQRNSTKNKYNELKTKVNRQNAQQIADLINEGGFYYNAIRFNLMDDGESDVPVYDENSMTLTVFDGTIIVPDGNHRTIGCELATSHLDDKFCVLFTFLSAENTRRLLNQEWTTVPIPKKHKDSMKQTGSNLVVDGILRSEDADPIYKKEIVRDGFETRAGHGFILYSSLADAIEIYYGANSIESRQKINELKDWLVSFFNVLTDNLLDDFKNYKKYKRTKWSVHPSAIYFYVMISKLVKDDKENWKEEVEQIVSSYDFSDEETRKLFVSNNKRAICSYCKEQEEKICITLNKKSNS